ncbi:MAG: hypothetical protein M1826_004311 [Phylliscum demangeonii]|nr:MAG: hypothetical protein M1826_004311 [Phylliscum demangeonii]
MDDPDVASPIRIMVMSCGVGGLGLNLWAQCQPTAEDAAGLAVLVVGSGLNAIVHPAGRQGAHRRAGDADGEPGGGLEIVMLEGGHNYATEYQGWCRIRRIGQAHVQITNGLVNRLVNREALDSQQEEAVYRKLASSPLTCKRWTGSVSSTAPGPSPEGSSKSWWTTLAVPDRLVSTAEGYEFTVIAYPNAGIINRRLERATPLASQQHMRRHPTRFNLVEHSLAALAKDPAAAVLPPRSASPGTTIEDALPAAANSASPSLMPEATIEDVRPAIPRYDGGNMLTRLVCDEAHVLRNS